LFAGGVAGDVATKLKLLVVVSPLAFSIGTSLGSVQPPERTVPVA
jgi:hypothetical protein